MIEQFKPTLEPISVDDFINLEYRNYALYSLYNRAIPSAIDGLKPSQRKIIFTANMTAKTAKKTAALAGDVISHANYHHGNSSLEDAIVLLSRKDNNIRLLDGDGYFGTRVVPKAAAARYTKSKIHANFKKYFIDNDICGENEDPESPEPSTYLPIIPWALVNGITGVAVGFATTIQPRNPDLLRKACAAHLMGRNISNVDLPPYYSDFKGTISKDPDTGTWKATGIVEHKRANLYSVLELTPGPDGKDRIKFVRILNQLRKISGIVDYKDRCSKFGFNFELKLKHKPINDTQISSSLKNEIRVEWSDKNKKYKPEQLDKEVIKRLPKRRELLTDLAIGGRDPQEVINSLIKRLHLSDALHDNLTTIDEHGDLKIFETANELVKHFTDYRLSMYTKRFEYYIKRDTELLKTNKIKIGFINAVNSGKIVLKGKNKSDSKALLVKLGIDENMANSLLSMPIHSFCDDEVAKLHESCNNLCANIHRWKTSDIRKEYLNDLKTLQV